MGTDIHLRRKIETALTAMGKAAEAGDVEAYIRARDAYSLLKARIPSRGPLPAVETTVLPLSQFKHL